MIEVYTIWQHNGACGSSMFLRSYRCWLEHCVIIQNEKRIVSFNYNRITCFSSHISIKVVTFSLGERIRHVFDGLVIGMSLYILHVFKYI